MNFDEIKSFSFLKQYSLQELKWFWELYSHGQFIYEKINKTVKVVFEISQDFPPTKKNVNMKAVMDLCKECQPDLQLIECLLQQGVDFSTFNQVIFEAWEYAHEEDIFRHFHHVIKSLRLYSKEDQKQMIESIICYINAVVGRSKLDSSLETHCCEIAKSITDTLDTNQIELDIDIAPSLMLSSKGGKRRRSRLSL